MEINNKNIEKYSKEFNEDPKNILARNAVTNSDLEKLLLNRNKIQKFNDIFSNVVKINDIDAQHDIEVADQQNSGRCWIFAFCNVLRYKMIKKYNLKDFEFSQPYIFFYDKLEKCNLFLNIIAENRHEKTNSRILTHYLKDPLDDGGNWNMFVNIVNKYGLVPKDVFNETNQTKNTSDINSFLRNKLRDYACVIKSLKTNNEVNSYIDKCMQEIYNIIAISMGEPPKKFDWVYKKSKGDSKKYKIVKNITPSDFYKKCVPFNVNDMITIINNPCKPYDNKIMVKYFNNMVNGVDIEYINLPMDKIKELVKKSIDNNDAIGFGCDVGKYLDDDLGVLDLNSINYKQIFNTDIASTKKDRLNFRTSDVTHAMVIKGYDNQTMEIKKLRKCPKKCSNKKKKCVKKKKCSKKVSTSNKPVIKYLIENSWGKDNGANGHLIMSPEYFDEYLYLIVIDKKHASDKILKILKKKPIMLEPWDPFGYLLLK